VARKVQDEASSLFEKIYNGGKGEELPFRRGARYVLRVPRSHADRPPRRRDDPPMAERLVAVDLLEQATCFCSIRSSTA